MKTNRQLPFTFEPGCCWATLFALVLFLSGSGRAQDFVFDGYSLDAGGGQSAGGDFELTGTVSQPDVGDLTGGDFALSGGFWGIVTALQSTVIPSLNVALSGSEVIVSWPQADGSGFVLESTAALAGSRGDPIWTRVDVAPQAANGILSVHLALGTGNQFYRLHQF